MAKKVAKMQIKATPFWEVFAAGPSLNARLAQRTGNAAGSHGEQKYGKRERSRNRKEEREAQRDNSSE